MFLQPNPKIKYSIIGILGIAALAYTIYKTYCKFFKDREQQTKGKEDTLQQSVQSSNQPEFFVPYQHIVQDKNCHKIGGACISYLKYLKDIHYHIILQIMKGKQYKGIVKISFYLHKLPRQSETFNINFRGKGIKLLIINGKAQNYEDVSYDKHMITFPKQLLKQSNQNTIEIIYENVYSFFNEGFSTYFSIDQHHKYSLKQQVIYSINDLFSIQNTIPCINCLNQCTILTQVIHPDHFQVFSNTSKAIQRFCSVSEYPKYQFLFNHEDNAKLMKLSIITQASSQFSDTMSHQSTNFHIRKKANSIFFNKKLSSIHQFFVFSSMMSEIQPTYEQNSFLSTILIRYYCKQSQQQKIKKSINKINIYITDIFKRLNKQIDCLTKIDIIILKDNQSQGTFAPGIILLSQKSLQEDLINLEVFYLITRSIIGMIKLQTTKSSLLSISDILQLNHEIFQRFEQFRNFLYIKNKRYQRLSKKLKQNSFTQEFKQKEGFYVRYYNKQLKYIILKDLQDKISFQLHKLIKVFHKDRQQQFWQRFVINYRSFSPLISQPFIKLAIRQIGVPLDNNVLLTQLKQCFATSKYILFFYTNHQISQNLSFFMEKQSYGLQKRLTNLKVKQKYANNITQKYEKYLPIKSNQSDAEIVYGQLKKFNQKKNFHHHQFLKGQIDRILCFMQDNLKYERLDMQCNVSGWKLLKRLKIYPLNKDWYELLCQLDENIQRQTSQ